MKKLLLSAAFLAAFIGANAQTTISFEASEGYTLGDVNGQNGWIPTALVDNDGNITGYLTGQDISNEMASDGSNSLKITRYGTAGQQNPIVGAFYNFETPFSDTAEYVVSFDIYANSAQDNSSSDFLVAGYTENSIAFYFRLNYQGAIYVADEGTNTQGEQALVLVNTEVAWASQTWYNVKVVISESEQKVEYFLNNNLIHTSTGLAVNTAALEQIAFTHDNYVGFAYLDDLYIGDASGLNVEIADSNSFSVYPNPATNVINVANSADVINNVTITDLNGRTVKQVTVGVNDAQINISDLAQGVYILNATSNGKSFTQKIVKQ